MRKNGYFAVSHFPEHKGLRGFFDLPVKFNIVTTLPLTGLAKTKIRTVKIMV